MKIEGNEVLVPEISCRQIGQQYIYRDPHMERVAVLNLTAKLIFDYIYTMKDQLEDVSYEMIAEHVGCHSDVSEISMDKMVLDVRKAVSDLFFARLLLHDEKSLDNKMR